MEVGRQASKRNAAVEACRIRTTETWYPKVVSKVHGYIYTYLVLLIFLVPHTPTQNHLSLVSALYNKIDNPPHELVLHAILSPLLSST